MSKKKDRRKGKKKGAPAQTKSGPEAKVGKKRLKPEKYRLSTHDPLKAIEHYKETHKDKFSTSKSTTINTYTRHGKVQIRLVPAPWSLVLLYAIVNAMAVFVVRIFWFDNFGKPSSELITPSSEVQSSETGLEQYNPHE